MAGRVREHRLVHERGRDEGEVGAGLGEALPQRAGVQQPGRVAVQINLTAAGRSALQNVTGGTLSLQTVASDFFGNDSTVTRTITLVQ